MELIEKIFRARQEFMRANKELPNKITISPSDYIELITERPYVVDKGNAYIYSMEVEVSSDQDAGKFIIE